MFGIPFYLMGLVWFPLTLVMGLFFIERPRILIPFLMVGNLFKVYLWYLEVGVIGAIYPVCVSLYAINYALTLIAWRNSMHRRKILSAYLGGISKTSFKIVYQESLFMTIIVASLLFHLMNWVLFWVAVIFKTVRQAVMTKPFEASRSLPPMS